MNSVPADVEQRRISKDPNNHRWTKDTTTFGQRILRSHGWTPGSFLGPQDAPHAMLHSSASASYIRVALKDDAGGLGYRNGAGGDDDIAGMDEVKSIFDRLNGVVESEEVKREREKKKALVYLGQRIGGITFVRGGLLVQEGLDMVETKEKVRVESLEANGKRKAEESEEEEAPSKKRRRDDEDKEERKKRKEEKRRRKEARITEPDRSADSTPSDDELKIKKSKRSKRDKSASESVDTEATTKKDKKKRSKSKSADPSDSDDEPRKEKKKKSKSKSADATPDPSDDAPKKSKKSKSSDTTPANTSDAEVTDLMKKDKKERKREKKEKKEKKRLKEVADDVSGDSTPADSDAPTGTSTPSSGPGVRHYHHARRVAAKRAAMSDAAALKQVGRLPSFFFFLLQTGHPVLTHLQILAI